MDLPSAEPSRTQREPISALDGSARHLLELLPDPVLVHDGDDGRVLFVNRAALMLAGARSAAQIVGQSIFALLCPEDRAEAAERMTTERRTPMAMALPPLRLRILRSDGGLVEVEAHSTYCADTGETIVVARDTSEQRRVEDALRESEERFRRMVDDLDVGILVHGPRGEIQLSNPRAQELLGRRGDQMEGRSVADAREHVIREDGSPFPCEELPVSRAIATRRPVRNVVMGVAREQPNDRLWLLCSAEPQLAPDGSVQRVLCSLSDVSERKRMEAQLALADRMSSLGTLAAGVAHEVNNPLSYVSMHTALLRERLAHAAPCDGCGPLFAESLAHLADVSHGLDRVRTIARDLRTFARGDDAELAPTDANAVIESSCSLVRSELGSRAQLVKVFGALPRVRANETRLGQVVLNLLINAVQAMPSGAATANTITVTTSIVADGRVQIEVRDSGVGIAPENLSRIFAPFFTTKAVGEGTGLGLWVCHSLVNAMGGEIAVESERGHGTVFRVLLQPAAGAPSERRSAPRTEPRPEAERLRVLVIDDEAAIGTALAEVLGAEHEVSVACTVHEALARLAEAEFDVVLADLSMPDGSGIDVLAWLEARGDARAGRVVFMSGGVLDERTRSAVDRARRPYLEKPFAIDAVRAVVRELGSR